MMEKEQTALQLIAGAARCPVYEPERILDLMEKLGINEKGFALLMNVAPFTVRLWTSGASQPSGTAMRLMQIFETAPEIVSKIAGESKSQMLGRNIYLAVVIRYNRTGAVPLIRDMLLCLELF